MGDRTAIRNFKICTRLSVILCIVGAGDPYSDAVVPLATAAARVADYCDSVEHNEAADRGWVMEAGKTLRATAFEFGSAIGENVQELYAERLAVIEQRGVAGLLMGAPSGASSARAAVTWRDLQLVQLQHDRHFHPDVTGLSKLDQLRHYAFHLAKLVAAYALAWTDGSERPDVVARRLPDTLLFGLALATVMGERLPDEPFVTTS